MEVRSFVGLASYYRRFVNNFASIATLLTNLTKKEIPFEWTKKCEENFQKLKTLLTTAPILALSTKCKYFIVYCDASHSGLDVVLMQYTNVIAYASLQLKVHERNYLTHDLELAMFAACVTQKDMNLRKKMWMELLKDYDVTIQYHPERGGVLASIEVRATFIEEINVKQFEDGNLNELKKKTAIGKAQETILDAEVQDAQVKAMSNQAKLLAAQSRQKKYADHKRYHGDEYYIIKWDSIMLDKDLQYEEDLVAILDRDVRKLRIKEIKSVQVQWKHHPVVEATWKTKRDMREKYPQLFIDLGTTPFFL
ncbi:hypothetical protein MTR67_003214 [Solanum verrucosum]|uniref:Reverse transcriptase/retrotransposon-derived protein RNase H-like domain-containing protein n=1 Tax=Solanum verrucosum TaxID=315347 RepID=A0AAF0PXM7_SOLVR|nr:hypothetical protein MTR67_003214 [Solanum verrucosum]